MNKRMGNRETPVVILCGGEGARLREFTEVIPKPLVPIGGKPILWHILRHYSNFGFRRFVLALGFKGEQIKEFLMEWRWRTHDFRLSLGKRKIKVFDGGKVPDWDITCVDTGLKTNTGGRVKRLERHVGGGRFMLTYGDGLADVPIDKLMEYHTKKRKTATLTGVIPFSSFGLVRFTRDSVITEFREKAKLNFWINGGFFVFEPALFDVLREDDILEERPLRTLAEKRQIAIFKHRGFWRCVDTYKDWQALNALAEAGGLGWLDRK